MRSEFELHRMRIPYHKDGNIVWSMADKIGSNSESVMECVAKYVIK